MWAWLPRLGVGLCESCRPALRFEYRGCCMPGSGCCEAGVLVHGTAALGPVVERDACGGQLRAALGLVEVRAHPKFRAAAGRETSPENVLRAWAEWPWAADHVPAKNLLVYTDGSAVLAAGWPKAVCKAG